ncbi:hypothetical protein C7437_102379 [Psychrobacillus insolitus]|uniref:Yip1-like protein n=1 Tax=Psychrobacillus insolitus TaxID=1461 RepID=A0A2W7MRT6_9BACI|nr:hypothetical protein [Psychrobacillus insolitus]PZX05912.1 hypothetical protein C7437_102379 [Psychrobacillus insolitus]
MFFDFRFWKHLFHQNELIDSLKNTTMRNFEKRVWLVAILGVLLYALKDIWGMNTEGLSSLFVEGYEDTYSVARITSLFSTIIFSLIYMAFHFFGIAYVLHKMTGVQLSKATIMQFFVVSLLLLEKAAIFAVFAILGYTTAFSFFSFGPLAATFLNNEFFIYFFNQLSIITAVVIALQFRFLRAFTAMSTSKLMILLIVLHLVLAALTAGISVLPLGEWIERGLAIL